MKGHDGVHAMVRFRHKGSERSCLLHVSDLAALTSSYRFPATPALE